jgi:hypothetical protein
MLIKEYSEKKQIVISLLKIKLHSKLKQTIMDKMYS